MENYPFLNSLNCINFTALERNPPADTQQSSGSFAWHTLSNLISNPFTLYSLS